MNQYSFYYYNETFHTLLAFTLSTSVTLSSPYEEIGFVVSCLKEGELDLLLTHLQEEELTLIMILMDKERLNTNTFINQSLHSLDLTELFYLSIENRSISAECNSADVVKLANGIHHNLFVKRDTQEYFILQEDEYEILEHCNIYLK